MSRLHDRRRGLGRALMLGCMVSMVLLIGATAAMADTRIMPDRDALKGINVVVWGNTTLANGTAFTLDCGDGSAVTAGNVADQSYISRTCNYANAGVFTAKLTVGGDPVANAKVTVGDSATLMPFDLRAIKINMAIEDGLRFLYFNQFNRAARFSTNMTSWTSTNGADNDTNSFSALAIQSIQNHGHAVNGPATDIFQPVVQRGLNWLFDKLVQRDLTPCDELHGASHDNPCVNVPAPVNIGLSAPTDGTDGYATPIFAAAIAAATAAQPGRVVDAGLGSANSNFVAGKTYSQILQRIVNSVAWGQSDSGNGEGGWYYNLQAGSVSDGSTIGWSLLGLIDAGSAGATVPAFVKTEFAKVLPKQLNNNGSFDYQVDNSPTTTSSNPAKTGVGIQGLFFSGAALGDARVTAATAYLVRNWTTAVDPIDFTCSGGTPSTTNKGCGYAMFNIFKALKLYSIPTLPGIGRAAGPGAIPADDWYADYVDNLLANQHSPTDPTRGEWSASAAPTMGWSCCQSDTNGITALAELILSPVAFVLPDPGLFSTVGLSPASDTNPVGTDHTVTAFVQSSAGAGIPGATVAFSVLTGPNAGATGTCAPVGCVSGADGKVSFEYHDTNGAGHDTIQASIGNLKSNIVDKFWVVPTIKCDADGDGKVALADLIIIRNASGQTASGATDPRDGNSDGVINVADQRYCQLRLTPAN